MLLMGRDVKKFGETTPAPRGINRLPPRVDRCGANGWFSELIAVGDRAVEIRP